MIDLINDLNIKEWLLVLFVFGMSVNLILWIVIVCNVLAMKATLNKLFNESELVRFLKEWKSG